ncbi:tetratricopeptide repeat protein [Glycomyces paridis]|uniref:Tetratricopeptide repeat protein n=1 Tax=Glycomyces paridis TaxID=2126555 RepID=A0A4S8PMA0_9ACTN|nr:tetratricopeptide repeat protein [Glycomyces paridis]THV31970.1 tetratricopeptide repeat protein [Glycomyces paridis]
MSVNLSPLWARAGGLCDRFERWGMACRYYAKAAAAQPRNADYAFRLGRVRERLSDFHGAVEAYTAAIGAGGRHQGDYYNRRAIARGQLGEWTEAVADLGKALDLQPGNRKFLSTLVKAEFEVDNTRGAAEALAELVAAGDTSQASLLLLAKAYADLARWDEAAAVYRTLIEADPKDSDISNAYTGVLESAFRTPFGIGPDDEVVPADAAGRDARGAAAVEQIQAIVDSSEKRVWATFRLAALQEVLGDVATARANYREAVRRAEIANQSWVHQSIESWTFRERYLANLQGELVLDEPDERYDRTVEPTEAEPVPGDAAGYVEAQVSNHGVSVVGVLRHGLGNELTILLDGEPIQKITADPGQWMPKFRSTITHRVAAHFPPHSVLSITLDGRPVVAPNGAPGFAVGVPGGDGSLMKRLADGYSINKKGRLSKPPKANPKREKDLVAGYVKLKDYLESELGVKAFLCYGTLLGCVRGGAIIPGDDDFDVSFLTSAEDPKAMKREGIEIVKALVRGGFQVRVTVDGRLMHVKVDNVTLDVNPVWFFQGKAWAFTSHKLGRESFEPVVTAEMGGQKVYIPERAEDFLVENYGADWRTPRSDFKYFRPASDMVVLRQAQLNPTEVQELLDYSEKARIEDPAAGRFHGYGDPSRPEFK